MANRNVSQLPENTDPQESDWLLGASGNSPTVLQKIQVGNILPTIPTIPTKTSELQNDSNFVIIDLTGIQNGQSFKWDSTLQKIVFFFPDSSSSSSSFFANFLIELMIPCLFITDYFQNGTINPRGF